MCRFMRKSHREKVGSVVSNTDVTTLWPHVRLGGLGRVVLASVFLGVVLLLSACDVVGGTHGRVLWAADDRLSSLAMTTRDALVSDELPPVPGARVEAMGDVFMTDEGGWFAVPWFGPGCWPSPRFERFYFSAPGYAGVAADVEDPRRSDSSTRRNYYRVVLVREKQEEEP